MNTIKFFRLSEDEDASGEDEDHIDYAGAEYLARHLGKCSQIYSCPVSIIDIISQVFHQEEHDNISWIIVVLLEVNHKNKITVYSRLSKSN